MAPEHPPSLVIFDATLQKNELVGPVSYIEAAPGEALRVRWNVGDQPPDFRPVGNGVAFVYTKNIQITEVSPSPDAKAGNLGDFRYRWTEGLQLGIPWLMFVLILPENYTLLKPRPLPTGVKNFNERIAVYWRLKGDNFSGTQVDWQIGLYKGDPDSEVVRINNISFVEEEADIYVGEIDRSQKKKLLQNHTRRLQKLKERQTLSGISVDPVVLIEIEDIEKEIESLKDSLKSNFQSAK